MKKLTLLLICVLTQILVSAQESIPAKQLPAGISPESQQIEQVELTGEQNQVMAMGSAGPESFNGMSIENANSMIMAATTPNLYTGTLGVQIPIYTINTRGISVPISLVYNGGGLRCTDMSMWVGAGWNLNAGGQISRVKRGKSDEVDNDDERDVFSFNLPGGLSGKFVFDKNWVVRTIPYQNIDIAWDRTANTFIIKDMNGLTYEFDVKETIKFTTPNETQATIVSWLLTRIKDYTGKVLVDFIYRQDATITYGEFVLSRQIRAKLSSSAPLNNLNRVETTINDNYVSNRKFFFLTEIAWLGGKLSFESSSCPNEQYNSYFPCHTRKLDKINLYAKDRTTKIKTIALNYIHRSPSNRFLLSTISDATSTQVLLFRMSYYNDYDYNSPHVHRYADHWGYFKSESADWFSSKIWSETGGRHAIPGVNTTEDRNPDLNYTRTDALSMIEIVPSGGCKLFDYELHDAYGFTGPVGGLRIKSITETDNLNSYNYKTKYEYKNSLGLSSGELYCANPVNFYVNTIKGGWLVEQSSFLYNTHDISGNYIGYSQVKTINPNGSSTVTKFTNHSNYPDVQEAITSDIFNVATNTYAAFNKHMMWKTSNAYKRGLPTEIINYDASGMQVSKQTNYYAFGPEKGRVTSCQLIRMSCSPSTLPIPYGQPVTKSSYTAETNYHWISVPVMLQSTTTEAKGQLPVTTTYTYDNTYYLPKEVTSVSGGVTQKTKIVYPFDYDITSLSVDVNRPLSEYGYTIWSMMRKRIFNAPIEKIYYRNGKLVGAELTIYQCRSMGLPTFVVPGIQGVLNLQTGESNSGFGAVMNSGLFICDPRYEFVEIVDEVDSELRPISLHDNTGRQSSVIYGQKCDSPIATVANAYYYDKDAYRLNQVYYNGFEEDASAMGNSRAKSGEKVKYGMLSIPLSNFRAGSYRVSYWKSTNGGETWEMVEQDITVTSSSTSYSVGGNYWIDEVRVIPASAAMTTYTYSIKGEKTSQTDPNGRTTYWEYDNLGRVVRILDNMRNPIKQYEYTIYQ